MPEPPSPHRRYGLLAALVAAAAAVTASVALFAPDPKPAPEDPDPQPVRWSATANQVAFADEQHGWALTPRCGAPTRCDPRFWRTLDGGATWEETALPVDELGRDTGVHLIAVGPRTVTVEAGRRRWLSTDSGATWRRGLAVDALRAPGTPPAGVRLRTTSGTRADQQQKTRPPRLLAWYAPDSGQPTAFPDQPSWQPISVSAARDGSVWATGGNAQVAVWAGRWQLVTPVLPPPPRTFVQVAAVDRLTAYLLVFGADEESLLRPTAISLTTDGGRTWQLRSLRGSTLRGSRDAAAVNGRLVVVDSHGGVQILVPGRKLAAPYAVEEVPALWALDSTGGRLLGTGMQDGRYWTTTDGEKWAQLRLPA
ncbi:hypothetical protein [Cryptosporangium aurantiacum]|uniref:Photosynthesis system II assembly factor Ycf48/Hcf136-like domain-containing protein n=1 Tax=Cryptosporangium aurantiacum TaxID=134849 RepID=A0A1M7KF25_9ACTN|nr:hypothetical protein [Cryptosporangium aurantiacum]SHM63864.1 hypothetical protein SAMN05443668_1011101 [Cryptosporangium aurantiacum]